MKKPHNTIKSKLHLLPLTNEVDASEVLAVSQTGRLFACDFGVKGVEQYEEKDWGYEKGRLINIDHHADTKFMRKRVSSTNLALRFVKEHKTAHECDHVIINHTDCGARLQPHRANAAICCWGPAYATTSDKAPSYKL